MPQPAHNASRPNTATGFLHNINKASTKIHKQHVEGLNLSPVAAFGCRTELDGHVARYRANRDLLIATLKQAGLSRFAPADGAFYLYVDVSALTRDSVAFGRRMLAEIAVAVTPGRDFDPIHGDDWVRLSFAGSAEDIAEAASRLKEWLSKQG